MNTIIMPVLLLGFVYGAWACNGTSAGTVEGTDSASKAFNDEVRARAKASMRGAHFCRFWEHICCCLRWAVIVSQATTTSRSFYAVSNFLHTGHHSRCCFAEYHCHNADPTMTQQYFGHFNCRRLSEYILVLHKDYETECWADKGTWWILAAMSAIGLLGISLGIPIGMWIWMRSVMQDEVKNIHEKTKSRPRAYRDFRDKFSYITVCRH